jgi:hypothetical protein
MLSPSYTPPANAAPAARDDLVARLLQHLLSLPPRDQNYPR